MGAFRLALEGVDSVTDTPTVTDGDNLGTIVIAAVEEFKGVEDSDKQLTNLMDDQKKVSEIKDVVAESIHSGGLSPLAHRILTRSLTRLVGKNITAKRIPSMESHSKGGQLETTMIALEGIAQTLKDFWTAIKNTATKFWNNVKQWYIKTLDGSNKIISRAKALEERANNTQGAAEEKSFEMGGISLLAVNYQVKDPTILIKGLVDLKTVLGQSLISIRKTNQATKAEADIAEARQMLEGLRKSKMQANHNTQTIASGGTNTVPPNVETLKIIQKYNELYKSIEDDFLKDGFHQVTDVELKKFHQGGNDKIDVYATNPLPGNRTLFSTMIVDYKALPQDLEGFTQFIKSIKTTIGGTSNKPREMDDSADVKTLNPSQVGNIAALCVEMGETALEYRKEFEARDRYFNTLVKGFDAIMRELEGSNVTFESINGFALEDETDGKPTQETVDNVNAKNQANQQKMADANQQQQQAKQSSAPNNGPSGSVPTPTPNQQNSNPVEVKADDGIDKEVRKLSQAFLGYFKKPVNLSGALINHSMKTCAVYLTYGERSLALYK